jgi:hypothetical protein
LTTPFDPNKSGRFVPYREPSKWPAVIGMVILMAFLVGLMFFLISL